MENEKQKLNLSGGEILALANALALSLYKNYDKCDLRLIKLLFQTTLSNLCVLESEGLHKKKC